MPRLCKPPEPRSWMPHQNAKLPISHRFKLLEKARQRGCFERATWRWKRGMTHHHLTDKRLFQIHLHWSVSSLPFPGQSHIHWSQRKGENKNRYWKVSLSMGWCHTMFSLSQSRLPWDWPIGFEAHETLWTNPAKRTAGSFLAEVPHKRGVMFV